MTQPLTTWYCTWRAQRDPAFRLPPSKKHKRRSHTNPAKTCIACGERQISQGRSASGANARKTHQCRQCYDGVV